LPPSVEHPGEEYEVRRRAVAELGSRAGIPADRAVDDTDVAFEPPPARPRIITLALAGFQILAAGISVIGVGILVVAAVLRKDVSRPWLMIGVLGVSIQGMLIVTAIAEIALPRYIFCIWSLLCASVVLFLLKIFERAASPVVGAPASARAQIGEEGVEGAA
jgi:hypothetical protein